MICKFNFVYVFGAVGHNSPELSELISYTAITIYIYICMYV